MKPFTFPLLFPVVLCCCGCSGIQSSLDPAGVEAERIARLYWWMAAGALAIWALVVALAVYYGRPHAPSPSRYRDRALILGAGVAFPVIVLAALLAYGLAMLPPLVARAPAGALQIEVSGELWWWRVRYVMPSGTIETANEIRLPRGEPVQLLLRSQNVIHSFWVPALGGKMDMIPGRLTYLTLTPTRSGVFTGACAEYCGTAHAFMRFYVEVMERPAFDKWLQHQAAPAGVPSEATAVRGHDLVMAAGCGACHTVRGTPANGTIAPDLTHVGGRMSLAAGVLENTATALARWIADTEAIKPGVHMPTFHMLPAADREAMAAYLAGLE
jgi:cytochrome c oxidase subunit 2